MILMSVRIVFSGESMYMLQDPEGEREMKCSLAQSLSRARIHKLFAVSIVNNVSIS